MTAPDAISMLNGAYRLARSHPDAGVRREFEEFFQILRRWLEVRNFALSQDVHGKFVIRWPCNQVKQV